VVVVEASRVYISVEGRRGQLVIDGPLVLLNEFLTIICNAKGEASQALQVDALRAAAEREPAAPAEVAR
jgi:hypothetical protein